MKNRTYRYFTGTPLYGFGYGLSYTRFAYSGLRLAQTRLHAGDTLTAEVEVKNTGRVAGDGVAQLYLVPPAAGNGGLSPKLQLEGFQRVPLKAGKSRKLTFTLSPRDLYRRCVATRSTRSYAGSGGHIQHRWNAGSATLRRPYNRQRLTHSMALGKF